MSFDTGEMSYREVRQSIVRLHGALAIEDSHVHFNNRGYCRDCRHRKVSLMFINFNLIGGYDSTIPREGVGIMTKPLRGGAISNLFIGETNWSYCLI